MFVTLLTLTSLGCAAGPRPVVVLPNLSTDPTMTALRVVDEDAIARSLQEEVDLAAIEADLRLPVHAEVAAWGLIVGSVGLPARLYLTVRVDAPHRSRPVRVRCTANAHAGPWLFDPAAPQSTASAVFQGMGPDCGARIMADERVRIGSGPNA